MQDDKQTTNVDSEQSAAENSLAETPSTPPIYENLVQAHLVPSARKSHKLLIAIISLIVVVLLGGAGAFAYYYTVVRVPDDSYTKASTTIDQMTADIEKIEAAASDWTWFKSSDTSQAAVTTSVRTVADTSDSTDLSAADLNKSKADLVKDQATQKYVKDFEDLLLGLQTSQVVSKDNVIKDAYAKSSKVIESYQSGFLQISDSKIITDNFDINCKYISLSNLKTLDDYDTITQGCNDFMTQNPTLPMQEYSVSVYEPVITTYKDYLAAIRSYLEALVTSNLVQYKASTSQSIKDEQKLEAMSEDAQSGKLYRPTKPINPTSQLNDLKTALQNRQKVFWR